MIRLFKVLAFIFISILLYVTCNQDSKTLEKKALAAKSIPTTTSTHFDTIQYDDGNLINQVKATSIGDTFGVWFTPPREAMPCSFVAVQYIFGSFYIPMADSFPIEGFVNGVDLYRESGPPLQESGKTINSFLFFIRPRGGEYTAMLSKPIPVTLASDFFIGWVSSRITAGQTIPIGLADTLKDYDPARGYTHSQNTWPPGGFHYLEYDLGVRAIFKYEVHDTGKYSIELQWKQPKTDLDLYLILPISKDTVYWHHPSLRDSIKLDVDDNDGYGPEKITCPILTYPKHDSLAQIGVHYYGPSKGKQVQARVIIKKNDVAVDTLGWCNLRPKDWWNVAWIYLYDGDINVEKPCDVRSNPNLSMIRKND